MKKLIQFLFVIAAIFLTGCGKFSDGTSVWQGGLWLVPTILFLASVYSFYRANRSRNSGMRGRVQNRQTGEWEWKESKEKVSFTEIGSFWFGIIFFLAFIVTIILVNADK